jgi:hypothetical protein
MTTMGTRNQFDRLAPLHNLAHGLWPPCIRAQLQRSIDYFVGAL